MSSHPTWQDQLRSLLDKYEKFATRDDAYRALTQMANVAERYIAEHPITCSIAIECPRLFTRPGP